MKNIYVIFMIIGFAGILLVVTNAPAEGAGCVPETGETVLCGGHVKFLTPNKLAPQRMVIIDSGGNHWSAGADLKLHQGQQVKFGLHEAEPSDCTPYVKFVVPFGAPIPPGDW